MRWRVVGLVVAWGLRASAADVAGHVVLEGELGPRKPVRPTVDKKVCGESLDDQSASGDAGTLANVVVWLEGAKAQETPAGTRAVLDQQRCQFVPRVVATRAGAELVIVNGDPTLHTVHAHRGETSDFNLATPLQGQRLSQRLGGPGVLEVRCDAGHPWMRAFIHLFDHPFFATTGPSGDFAIAGVPAGRYRAKAWHERFGVIDLGELAVAEAPVVLPIVLDAKKSR